MRPSANRKEDHMLKKVVVASCLALGFFVSFQVGNSKGTGGATEGGPAVKIQVIEKAKACDGHCSPQDEDCC